jgi:hypothetical protein
MIDHILLHRGCSFTERMRWLDCIDGRQLKAGLSRITATGSHELFPNELRLSCSIGNKSRANIYIYMSRRVFSNKSNIKRGGAKLDIIFTWFCHLELSTEVEEAKNCTYQKTGEDSILPLLGIPS